MLKVALYYSDSYGLSKYIYIFWNCSTAVLISVFWYIILWNISFTFIKSQSHRKCKCKKDTAAAAKSLQSCPTLCDPIDGSPPGSSVHGIFQARVLEWVAVAFSEVLFSTLSIKILCVCVCVCSMSKQAYIEIMHT